MSHGDVVNLIKESGLHVRLTIGCPKDPLITSNPILSSSPLQQPPSIIATTIKSEQSQPQQPQQQSYTSDRSQLIQHPQL